MEELVITVHVRRQQLRPTAQSARFQALSPTHPRRLYTGGVRSHEWIDARSLALHDAVAAKLEQRPQLMDRARANLARWLAHDRNRDLIEWARLLDQRSIGAVVALLRSTDETAARLRQSSPFAGVLTPAERLAIFKQYDARRS